MTPEIRRVTDPAPARRALLAAAGTARAADGLCAVLARAAVHLLVAHVDGAPVGTVIAWELPDRV